MGLKVVFDTNALINFLNGHPALKQYGKATIFISIISVIEFLSYPKLTQTEKQLLNAFLNLDSVFVIDLEKNNNLLLQHITDLRKTYKIKLPDAIIAASALLQNASLVTTDKDFNKITLLKIILY